MNRGGAGGYEKNILSGVEKWSADHLGIGAYYGAYLSAYDHFVSYPNFPILKWIGRMFKPLMGLMGLSGEAAMGVVYGGPQKLDNVLSSESPTLKGVNHEQ